ncbi:fungal hydrophobin-domain-containing protein [Infundibulicybe gibba]|nr:fungal hydrophobin-domain-containing protein [Infundibulicybe gibba]
MACYAGDKSHSNSLACFHLRPGKNIPTSGGSASLNREVGNNRRTSWGFGFFTRARSSALGWTFIYRNPGLWSGIYLGAFNQEGSSRVGGAFGRNGLRVRAPGERSTQSPPASRSHGFMWRQGFSIICVQWLGIRIKFKKNTVPGLTISVVLNLLLDLLRGLFHLGKRLSKPGIVSFTNSSKIILTMISRVASAFFLVLPPEGGGHTSTVTVTTTAAPAPTQIPASQCNTGDLQCCNSIQSASSGVIGALLALLGIDIEPITAIVGLTCSPLSIVGIGGNSCSAQPVCCQNNDFPHLCGPMRKWPTFYSPAGGITYPDLNAA